MLFVISALTGCPVEASDGHVGTVKDFLFDDKTWRVRWMVVDTGTWLSARKVLVHPSAIAPLHLSPPRGTGQSMLGWGSDLALTVRLKKAQIEASPDISENDSVSKQTEDRFFEYYGCNPSWGTSYFAIDDVEDTPFLAAVAVEMGVNIQADRNRQQLDSVNATIGYHIHATDGDIGHIENFLVDDVSWDLCYFVVATGNWWPGEHVRLTPYAVQNIDRVERRIRVNVTRDQVKSSPPWDPLAMIDAISEKKLHDHYGWPGYSR